jgi:hypothetical protein
VRRINNATGPRLPHRLRRPYLSVDRRLLTSQQHALGSTIVDIMDLLVAESCLHRPPGMRRASWLRHCLDGKSNGFTPSLFVIRPTRAISMSAGPVSESAAIGSRFTDLSGRITQEDDGYVVHIRLHNAATPQPGNAVGDEEIAGPTHSTEGVCGPSFNGVVNDHQIGFDSSREINLRLLQPTGRQQRNPPATPSLASTSVVKAPWLPALPIRRRADCLPRICRSCDRILRRTKPFVPH